MKIFNSTKTTLKITGIFIVLFLIVFFWNEITSIIDTDTKITIAQLATAIGVIISAGLVIWRTIVYQRRVNDQIKQTENLTKRVENEADTVKNQQFLDAIKIFGEANINLEAKKGALYHLENLAITSPAHRQRVLDFINSLNSWMRKPENFEILKKKETEDWNKWKNEKQIILPKNENHNEQLLSAEIPKIFENIICEHSKQWQKFSEQEKEKYKLDFSYFIFPHVNFSKINFLQEETIFSYAYFLGDVIFWQANFSGVAYFNKAVFSGIADFIGTKFKEAYFQYSKFSTIAFFVGATFEVATFIEANFIKLAQFNKATFSGKAYFSKADFSYLVIFEETAFSAEAYFIETIFSENTEEGIRKKAKFSKEPDFTATIFKKEKSNIILKPETANAH